MKPRRARRVIAIALLGLVVAGCGASAPAKFYTFQSNATPDGLPLASYGIVIAQVAVPAVVDRPQFVVQVAPNRVEIDEFNRWAAPLGETIADAVATDLGVRLGTPNVATAMRASFAPTYRVTIDIQRFDSIAGEAAVLEAVWAVTTVASGRTLSGKTIARETLQERAYTSPIWYTPGT
ncbi:MAG TPA: ABC-type transport auxiliary lipoprotein family protein [Candidatus Binatia bacterium]|nr:ABC-type transport auxiliary lipoprotein family protein [Candidatus Binatia bacterium]